MSPKTTSPMPIAGLIVALVASMASPAPVDGQRRPPRPTQSQPHVPAGPAPDVTSHVPQERAHPGQVLVISGREFRPQDVRVELRTASGSVLLPIQRATATRIETRITDMMYTGAAGAELAVYHRGAGGRTVLDADFQVLDRDATFAGTSFFHELRSRGSNIFTRGEVELRLGLFEFESRGKGFYRENLPVVRVVEEWSAPCGLTKLVGGPWTAPGRRFDWKTERFEREIEWRKLPDGRVELKAIGPGDDRLSKDAIARFRAGALTIEFETTAAGVHTRPAREEPDCRICKGELKMNAPPGMPECIMPLVPVPLRLVEWTLERRDAR